MPLPAHGDLKYDASSLRDGAAEWDALRIEHRLVGSGSMNPLTSECTELVFILSGKAKVRRRGDGQLQEGIARPGSSWLVPARTHETLLELDGSTECLHMFLPDTLVDKSALADYEIDPSKTRLAYVGGLFDPVLAQIATMLRGMVGREVVAADRMYADGLRTALAARLIGNYTVDEKQRALRPSCLDARRLDRVLDFIEAHLGDAISLDDLAREACLSSFHFARLFREATGVAPHRYVTERRVRVARDLLAVDKLSLTEIAFKTGFGSQHHFPRTFRRVTGLTPGQHRSLYTRCAAASHDHLN